MKRYVSKFVINSCIFFPIATSLVFLCLFITYSTVTGKQEKAVIWFTIHFITIVLLWASYIFSDAMPAEKSVKIVHILFRNGMRYPIKSYKNDPYKEIKWPDGHGSLTKEGKRASYQLGTILRKRYKRFFNEDSMTGMMLARSSDYDRCLMSAGAFLAGFFPPTKKLLWNPSIKWTPVPIFSTPLDLDNLILQLRPCSAYERELHVTLNSQEMQEEINNTKDVYDYINKMSGENLKNPIDMYRFYVMLNVQSELGLHLPLWTKSVFPKQMKDIAKTGAETATMTPIMKRLTGGQLLKEIIDLTRAEQDHTLKPEREFYIYSGHDFTIVNLMNTLNVYSGENRVLPEFGAAFIVEGHRVDDRIEIRLFYFKDYATRNPIELSIPKCPKRCYLDDFNKLYKDVLPRESRDIECRKL